MKILKLITALLISMISMQFANAQENKTTSNDTIYMVSMKEGSVIYGKIISKNDSLIILETKTMGKTSIMMKDIQELKEMQKNSFVNGQYRFPNPHATRYFFGSSAINLKKGEGYYQNTYLLLNSFYIGITDYINIGGGFEFLTLFATGDPVYFLSLKGGGKISKNFYLAAGTFFFSYSNGDNRVNNLLAYGIATYGNHEHNFSIGTGFNFNNKEYYSTVEPLPKYPIFTLSGMTRVSRKVALVTENWIIPATTEKISGSYFDQNGNYVYHYELSSSYRAYISYGLRFLGEKLSVDLGLVNTKEIAKEFAIGIPYVDFVVKF